MNEHNNSIGKSANQIPITAYLSYRQRNTHNATALELLEKHCSDQHIKLVYDKQEIKPGESIKAFMDELASARCIFIFLTPDYFESAYTLYELVTIDQWADLDRRFIHPIRVTENMNATNEGCTGGYTIVCDFIRNWRNQESQSKSTYVPLRFSLGETFQIDWSEEWLVIGGIHRKILVAHTKLCASRSFMLSGYPSQGHEMLLMHTPVHSLLLVAYRSETSTEPEMLILIRILVAITLGVFKQTLLI